MILFDRGTEIEYIIQHPKVAILRQEVCSDFHRLASVLHKVVRLTDRKFRAQCVIRVPLCLPYLHQFLVNKRFLQINSLVKSHLVSQRKHDPVFITFIWHPCMPGSQVSQHNIAFLAHWLDGRPHFPSRFHNVRQNITLRFSYSELCVGKF